MIAFDEMWTYQQARRRGQRQNSWVWTAVVSEPDGSRWADFEIGDRSADTILRLYERLPEAGLYGTDAYRCTGGCRRIVIRWVRAVNWN